ncbi:MAG: hypothetical protein ACJ786_36060 [Catenulispora sp.]|jgi:hypothetical protein
MRENSDVASVVVDELKKQARAEGYYVLAMPESDLWLLLACSCYFLLGMMWASR